MDQSTVDMQNEIAELRRLVHDLQLRVSTLERKLYAEPVTPIWLQPAPAPCAPPFHVTC